MTQLTDIKNKMLKQYDFLQDMFSDDYYPKFLVEECKQLLIDLCIKIESEKPETLAQLYVLTHATTEQFNDMVEKFANNDSDLETMARETIAEDFAKIAQAYGFNDADVEELIATRDW